MTGTNIRLNVVILGLILSDFSLETGQICGCLVSKKEAYGAPHLLQLISERTESPSWCPGAASSLFTHSIIHSGCNWHLRSARCPAASLPSRHLSCLINCQGSRWNYAKVCFFFPTAQHPRSGLCRSFSLPPFGFILLCWTKRQLTLKIKQKKPNNI